MRSRGFLGSVAAGLVVAGTLAGCGAKSTASSTDTVASSSTTAAAKPTTTPPKGKTTTTYKQTDPCKKVYAYELAVLTLTQKPNDKQANENAASLGTAAKQAVSQLSAAIDTKSNLAKKQALGQLSGGDQKSLDDAKAEIKKWWDSNCV